MDDLTSIPPSESPIPQRKRQNVAFIIVIVFFGVIGILALFNNGRSTKKNANTIENVPFQTGTTVVINYGSDKFDTTGSAVVAVDLESLNAFSGASQNGSAVLDTLMSLNKIFTTPNGTKARVLDSGSIATQIRIIEGDALGKDGWVSNVFLYN